MSSMSSSFSAGSSSESKPSRTITWQVVQAQDFSQACSISMSFSSRASQTDLPLGRFEHGAFRAQDGMG